MFPTLESSTCKNPIYIILYLYNSGLFSPLAPWPGPPLSILGPPTGLRSKESSKIWFSRLGWWDPNPSILDQGEVWIWSQSRQNRFLAFKSLKHVNLNLYHKTSKHLPKWCMLELFFAELQNFGRIRISWGWDPLFLGRYRHKTPSSRFPSSFRDRCQNSLALPQVFQAMFRFIWKLEIVFNVARRVEVQVSANHLHPFC